MLASTMTKHRRIREDIYVKRYKQLNITGDWNIEAIRV